MRATWIDYWTNKGETNLDLDYLLDPLFFSQYGRSLLFGCNHLHQSLPRMLSLWFDFGSRVHENEQVGVSRLPLWSCQIIIVKCNIQCFCLLLFRRLLSGQYQANEHQRGRDVEELNEDERVHEQIRQFLSVLHLSCGTTSTNFPDLSLAHWQVTLPRLNAGSHTLVQLFCFDLPAKQRVEA